MGLSSTEGRGDARKPKSENATRVNVCMQILGSNNPVKTTVRNAGEMRRGQNCSALLKQGVSFGKPGTC